MNGNNVMTNLNITLDPDIIPNEKERFFKEALEGFRRATNLHDALLTINTAINYTIKEEKIRHIYNLTAMNLEQDRNAILDSAVVKYLKSKDMK